MVYLASFVCFGISWSDLEQKRLEKKERMRAHRLQILRFWLLHSVNSIHNYLMGQVLHSLGLELEQDVQEADNLDSLVNGKFIKYEMWDISYIHSKCSHNNVVCSKCQPTALLRASGSTHDG